MRWRFVDRIDGFEPWVSARGRKSISLEEYSLLEPFGRKGIFPETLALESCVHLARWLVVRSSGFQNGCLISGVDDFVFRDEVGMGDTLDVNVVVLKKDEKTIQVGCEATHGRQSVCQGTLTLDLITLKDILDPEPLIALWQELYGKA